MITIAKRFDFSASHQLDHLEPDHPCARLHGHNYSVVLLFAADNPDERTGMVRDFRELDVFKRELAERFDHRHLNEVMGSGIQTTSEALARYFLHWCRIKYHWYDLVAVRVSETEKTYAEASI